MSRNELSPAEKAKQLQLMKNTLNRKAKGKQIIASAGEVANTFTLRRPSGIAQLDIDTGGGLPAGGLSYISGPDNAGKTYLLWKYFAMQQRIFGKNCYLAYAATESAPDYFFARKCGVMVEIPDEMIEDREKARKDQGLPPFTKEELKEFKTQVGTFEVVRGEDGEQILSSLLTLFDSGLFNMIALDSVSAIVPGNQAELELEENGQQGAQATLLGKFAKKFYPKVTGLEGTNYTTVVFTAQVRANRKKAEMASYIAKYVDDYATVGSYEMRHLKLLDILVSSGSFDKEKNASGGKTVTGKTLRWKMQKGKAGTHDGITGETDVVYAESMDDVRTIIPAGVRYGVLTVKGDHVSVVGDPNAQNIPVEDFLKMLRADFKAEMKLRHRLNAAAGISCIYT